MVCVFGLFSSTVAENKVCGIANTELATKLDNSVCFMTNNLKLNAQNYAIYPRSVCSFVSNIIAVVSIFCNCEIEQLEVSAQT